MTRIAYMHKKWVEAAKYRKAYEALDDEFALAWAAQIPSPLAEQPGVIITKPC
jgi:hypothetical protein